MPPIAILTKEDILPHPKATVILKWRVETYLQVASGNGLDFNDRKLLRDGESLRVCSQTRQNYDNKTTHTTEKMEVSV